MDNFFDWSDDAIAPLKPAKTKQSETLAAEVERFLAGGGTIEQVPYNPIPEMIGAIWTTKEIHPNEEGMTRATYAE